MTNCSVLVLNRHFQPIHVTNAKRAFSLLYLGVARVDRPRVPQLRLRELGGAVGRGGRRRRPHHRPRHPRAARDHPADLRPHPEDQGAVLPAQHLHARRQHLPVLRAGPAAHRAEPRPRRARARRAGRTTWENVVCCCIDCNLAKGARTPDQAHMTLRKAPSPPALDPHLPGRRGSHPLPRVAPVPGRGQRLVLERRAPRRRRRRVVARVADRVPVRAGSRPARPAATARLWSRSRARRCSAPGTSARSSSTRSRSRRRTGCRSGRGRRSARSSSTRPRG